MFIVCCAVARDAAASSAKNALHCFFTNISHSKSQGMRQTHIRRSQRERKKESDAEMESWRRSCNECRRDSERRAMNHRRVRQEARKSANKAGWRNQIGWQHACRMVTTSHARNARTGMTAFAKHWTAAMPGGRLQASRFADRAHQRRHEHKRQHSARCERSRYGADIHNFILSGSSIICIRAHCQLNE